MPRIRKSSKASSCSPRQKEYLRRQLAGGLSPLQRNSFSKAASNPATSLYWPSPATASKRWMPCLWKLFRPLNPSSRHSKKHWEVFIMSLKVVIPAPLRKFTNGAESVEVEAATVQEVLNNLDSKYPGFRASICDESGSLRRFINIYINGEDVRFLENLSTRINDGAEVAIVPAISGGKMGT